MPLCVRVAPVNESVGSPGGPGMATLSVPMIAVDSTCASGLQILTTAEIQANKSQLTMDTTSSPERVADMLELFYAFILVLVVVWGLKQLLNLFTGDTSKD